MPRRLLLLLAAFTALALTSLAGIATAASTGTGPQNGVGALQTVGPSLVGAVGTESSCTHPGLAGSGAGIVSGFCVAAEEGTQFYYGDRVLARAAEEPGPYHNFPSSFDQTILKGNREVVNEGYVSYTAPGSINGVKGVYEIGTRPTALGTGEVITHRFFNPGG